jgi:hypothetical protein
MRYARNPEVVVVQNPAFPHFSKGKTMAKKRRKARKSKYNRKRGYTARRKHHYNRKRRKSRRNSAFSSFVKKQWRLHKAHYKSIGFRNASKQIAKKWKSKK